MSQTRSDQEWWHGGVIYQVYPRSFQDSTGNGIGDLKGITSRLDQIASLGVDAIWMSPFFRSPMKDFGYDVSDYCDIDPLFGTQSDFDELVDRAHSLGLKVMIDQVWSHTSDQHPWFAESRSSRESPRADWYTWADAKADGSPPNNWLSVFGGSAWMWDTRREQYYLHNFLAEQPDLNFHNPEVQDAMLDVARFWFERGVDGFRLDVCNFYFQDRELRDNPVRGDGKRGPNPHDWQTHTYCRNQPENLVFLSQLRNLADSYGARCLMGEIGDNNGLPVLMEYTRGDERLHTAYSFDFLGSNNSARYLHSVLQKWSEADEGSPTWALGNHDVPRVATRWSAGEPTDDKLRLYAAFQFCLKGTLCLFQGEELGLEQAVIPFEKLQDPEGKTFWPSKPGRDGCRTPMPWSNAAPLGGFSDAIEAWLPQPEVHRRRAAESQREANGSLLKFYQDLIALRRDTPGLRYGDLELMPSDPQVLGFERKIEADRILCVFNFSDQVASVNHLQGSGIVLRQNGFTGAVLKPSGWAIIDLEGQK